MLETNTNGLKGTMAKHSKLNSVCRSYANWKADEHREHRAKKVLAEVEGDEIDVMVAEARLERFDQETRPIIERMRKALRPISNHSVELRNISILSGWR